VVTYIMMMRRAAMAIVDASLFNDGAVVGMALMPKSFKAAPVEGDELHYYRVKTEDQEKPGIYPNKSKYRWSWIFSNGQLSFGGGGRIGTESVNTTSAVPQLISAMLRSSDANT
jgi:hypothetical protein